MERVPDSCKNNARRFLLLTMTFVLAFSIVPYLLAWAATPDGYHYMWNSYNPQDADTYLAKMRLGWLGEWRFRLMHTPERQPGVYLNLFYLLLGHGARWLHLPLLSVFHGMRILMAFVLLYALWWLGGRIASTVSTRCWAVWFAFVGGGVGWAAAWLHPVPVDLSLPEAYGFLSALVNPHFPAAQVLLVVLLGGLVLWVEDHDADFGIWPLVLAVALLCLSVIQPFAVVTVGIAWGLWLGYWMFSHQFIYWKVLIVIVLIGCLGLLYPLYGVLSIQQDPVLSGWNAQNLTPSPPWWTWILGYAVSLPFVLIGIVRLLKQHSSLGWMLIAWIVAIILGIISPLGIQRRFSLGLSIPIGLLAGVGWAYFLAGRSAWRISLQGGMVVLTLATPFAMALVSVRQPQYADLFYIREEEIAAANFLLDLGPGYVLLSSPTRGEALPWLSGQQVVIGHSMETVAYQRRETEVKAFFDGSWGKELQSAFICKEGVDYIWWGPIERALSKNHVFALPGALPIFENDAVSVFAVKDICRQGE